MGRGQVTLFVIFGIIILIVSLILAFIVVNLVGDDGSEGTFDTENIEFMITDCIKRTGSNGLDRLGQNGNYIDVPDLLKYQGTSYWIYQYGNVEPVFNSSIDEFQEWFNQEFLECLDFDSFPGYEFSYDGAKSYIEYGADEVIFRVNFPINITREEKVKTLEEFTVVSNIRYRRILEKSRDIINAHYIQNFDYLDALEFVDEENFDIEYQVIDQDNLVFTITERDKIEFRDYVFKFATNLEQSNLKRTAIITEDSLDFFIPYMVYSPDRMAVLMLNEGVEITGSRGSDINNITIWAEYTDSVSREVTSEVVHTDGKKDSSSQSDITYVLDYPIYNFEPNGTKFSPPQRLAISWDHEKIPNQGLMGMLYKGALSDNEWRPVTAKVNYDEHFVYGDISGFSQFTIVDCARQECKEAVVTGKSEPASLCMGWAMMLIIAIAILIAIILLAFIAAFVVGALIGAFAAGVSAMSGAMAAMSSMLAGLSFGLLGTATGAVGAALTTTIAYVGGALIWAAAIGSAVTAGVIINGAGFEEGDTSVGIIPTCDQIIDSACEASDKLEKGDGTLGGTTIPKNSAVEVDATAGEEMMLTAIAKKCKKDAFKCYPCEITCRAGYK